MSLIFIFAVIATFGSSGSSLEAVKEFEIGAREMLPELEHHQLLMNLNPGCPVTDCHPNSSLTVANFTIHDSPSCEREHHWIWTLIDRPAMQVALTKANNTATINWSGIFGFESLDSVIGYHDIPDYSAAVMLANVIEYDDKKNLGYLEPSNQDVIVYSFENFAWNRTIIEDTSERVAFELIAENYTAPAGASFNLTEGKLNITFSAYAINGFGRWLPHLTHSESTNQIDVQLQSLKSNSMFNHSRFALEIYLVSNAQKRARLIRQATKTLDDEHTPGIFTTQELIMPGYNDSLQAYLQWRPVVYTTMKRDLSASTDVNITKDVNVEQPAKSLRKTILYAFYGQDLEDMLVRKINVSMGAKGDGFYKKTGYQAWTFTLGTGKPIHNGMSPMIILVITIMLGILMIVLMTACIVCAIKKVKKRRENSYGRLDNDNN